MRKVYSLQFTVYSLLLALLTVHCTLYTICYAQPLSSTELINNAKQYDGKAVVYEGEAIGELMLRSGYAWVNVHDGNNAIGIWLASGLAGEITHTGSYKFKGDRIEMSGIFHRACFEHGGDLDIHAQGLRKTSPGRLLPEKFNPQKKNLAIVLFGALVFIWILTRFLRK